MARSRSEYWVSQNAEVGTLKIARRFIQGGLGHRRSEAELPGNRSVGVIVTEPDQAPVQTLCTTSVPCIFVELLRR